MSASPVIVTRFAPSPTGFLHIGGARTALFNYLLARRHGGRFLLRIEDTDKERSTNEAIEAILDGMRWLGLDWDGEAVMQSARAARHAEVAQQLLAAGKAYHCYATAEELEAMREAARINYLPMKYNGLWRDRDPAEAPPGVKPTVRIRARQDGETVVDDLVQGRVVVQNSELDDFVLLRSDGTPTYMLAVVVDDHDMGVTHVIRGDDHLNNAFRQLQIIEAMGWPRPEYGHIPLIHGADGAKLSKRHGALGVSAYRDMGFLPEALENYLLRLGWSHGDDEIISRAQATAWFNTESIGRNPARFDMAKLSSVNAHYLKASTDERLLALALPLIAERLDGAMAADGQNRVLRLIPALKSRAKTIVELAESALFAARLRPIALDESARTALQGEAAPRLAAAMHRLSALKDWSHEALEAELKAIAADLQVGFGKIGPLLRAALTGSTAAPGVADILVALQSDESLARLQDALAICGDAANVQTDA